MYKSLWLLWSRQLEKNPRFITLHGLHGEPPQLACALRDADALHNIHAATLSAPPVVLRSRKAARERLRRSSVPRGRSGQNISHERGEASGVSKVFPDSCRKVFPDSCRKRLKKRIPIPRDFSKRINFTRVDPFVLINSCRKD